MENLPSGIGESRTSSDGPCRLPPVCFPAVIYLVNSQAHTWCEVNPHGWLLVCTESWTEFLSVFPHLSHVTTL